MNFKMMTATVLAGLCAASAFADTVVTSSAPHSTTSIINSSTLSASAILSPGRYMTTVAPSLDGTMTDRLEKAFKSVPGIKDASAHSDDSSIHFTVKNGSQVRVVDLQKIVAQVDRSAVISTPILEDSLTPTPGL